MKKMFLVFNPKSGRGEFIRNLYNVIELFSRAEYEVVAYPTSGTGDALACIQERGLGFDLIVCAGGDGIVNEAVNAYMKTKSLPLFGYIPSGTTNDFAVSLGLPLDMLEAARTILKGQSRMIDIGKLGDQYFSYVAAFGQFTDIPYSTAQSAKNIFGRMAYLIEGIKHLVNITNVECSIDIDGEIIEGSFLLGIITNSISVGGFKIQSDGNAAFDDGLFEVIFIRSPDTLVKQSELMAALAGTSPHSEMLIQRKTKKVIFNSTKPCSWTVDGEFGGRYTEVAAQNIQKAISIIVPE